MTTRSERARSGRMMLVLLATTLVLAAMLVSAVTARDRETRTVGVIAITADTFTDLGNGQTRATGNVWLGDHLGLTGDADSLVFDSTRVTGTGSLALLDENLPLFTGDFQAQGGTGVAVPDADVAYELEHIAGFPIGAGLAIDRIDIPSATVNGSASITLNPPGVTATAGLNFSLTPGPGFAGTLGAFNLAVAGVTLQTPAGATLDDGGVDAPSVTLLLPDLFGGASVTVNDLHVGTDGLSLGSAGASFGVPDLLIGDGSALKFTGNQAILGFDGGAYRLELDSTLNLNLPGNAQTGAMQIVLASDGGQPQLSGTLAQLQLDVAGATVTMSQLALGNDGLAVDRAALALPDALGGGQASVADVRIAADGLHLGAGAARFPLPEIEIGDGRELALQAGQALLAIDGDGYRLDVNGQLAIDLPENQQTIAAAASLANGQLSGTLDGLTLSVAGASLSLSDVALGNDGLDVAEATLALPTALGGAVTTVDAVHIGDDGLTFGSAGSQFDLPDIAWGGSQSGRAAGHASVVRLKPAAAPLSLTGNQATLEILSGGSGYRFRAGGVLNIDLPGNQQQRNLNFTVSYDPQTSFRVQGSLDALSLTVAGSTLQFNSLQLDNGGLSAGSAVLTLPAGLGGATTTLNDLTIDAEGLGIAGGQFDLPSLTLAGGKATLQNVTAELAASGGVYEFSASGSLVLNLPENQQTLDLTFTLDGEGNVDATLAALTLKMAGTTLAMAAVDVSNAGLAAGSATLTLPAGLGGATAALDQVQVTADGLSFGQAGLTVILPDFSFGSAVSVTGSQASLTVAGGGSSYLLAANATLGIDLPDNQQQQAVSFSLASAGDGYDLSGSLSGLTLDVAGATLTLADVALDNQGLAADSGTLALPAGLGGGTVTVEDIAITGDGLSLGDAQATIPLPDLVLGSGEARFAAGKVLGLASPAAAPGDAPLALRDNQARLAVQGSSYVFSVASTLHLSLPGNSQADSFDFTLSKDGAGYNLAGTLDNLSLDIAGSTLAMSQLALSNSGLQVDTATLALPAGLGGSATVSGIAVDGDGLHIGSGSISLPDITFGGDGSQLVVSGATAGLAAAGDAYTLSGSGTLKMRLPDNAQDIDLAFSLSGGQFDASLSSLSLSVAGATLALGSIDFDNAGLHVDTASLTLPAGLGGASGELDDVSIGAAGLSIGGGSFTLPDIAIGDGSSVRLSGITAELAVTGGSYVFSAGGTLNLNLPGNVQSIAVQFTVDSNGDMAATLDQIRLTIAGATLTMTQVVLSNAGLAVDVAMLQLPGDLGGATGRLDDVSIGAAGLSIGGGSFTLPDLAIGDGSRVRVNNPTGTLAAAAGGYTFGIQGTLQLRLPENSQDIALAATLDEAGHFSARLDQLTLTLASLQLHLADVAFTNSGLQVAQGTLTLPASLGGGAGQVDAVRIDGDGLHIGGAGASFPFPDFKLGSSSGFSVRGVTATLAMAADQTYKVTLAGTVEIDVPGSSATATGSISVDSRENVSGSLSAFTLSVAGLALEVDDVTIDGHTLSAATASLNIPAEWGGASAAVYNLTVSPADGIKIGGASFTLPDIEAGGFILTDVGGSLKPVSGGYEINGHGKFGLPGLSAGGNCAVGVDVTVATNAAGELVLSLAAPAGYEDMLLALNSPGQAIHNIPMGATAPAGLALRNVHLGLYGCAVPIGDTGFSLTRAEGDVTLSSGSTRIEVGVTVESTDLQVAGQSALRGQVDMSMATNPAEFGLSGSIYVFAFHAGQLNASITERDGFKGTLWIDAIVAQGNFTVHAWSTAGRFHLTGSAQISIGIPEGEIYEGCVPYPCCHWHHWHISCHTCHACVSIPPHNWTLGGVNAEFGEFWVSGGGTAYGFKGWVSVLGYDAGFYVDDRGHLTIGNVDKYHLVDSKQVWEAIQGSRTARLAGARLAEPWVSPGGLAVLPNEDVVVSVPVSVTTDLAFAFSRNSITPTLTLVTPGGVEITADSLPANVQYLETYSVTIGLPGPDVTDTVTITQHITQSLFMIDQAGAGTWLLRIGGELGPDDHYLLAALGVNPPPVLSDVSAQGSGPTGAQVAWRLVSREPETLLSIYANPAPAAQAGLEHTGPLAPDGYVGALVAQLAGPAVDGTPQVTDLDLSGLESGTYWLWLSAEDGRNPPVRTYAPAPVTVQQPAALKDAWDPGLRVTAGYRRLQARWNRHPHPDVDGYVLLLGTTPLTMTRAITVGQATTGAWSALEPGKTYYVAVAAHDEAAGWSVQSPSVAAATPAAPFALAVTPQSMEVAGGQSSSVSVTLSTDLAAYPGPVTLSTGPLPDGIVVALDRRLVTPTVQGAAVTAVISTTRAMAGGVHVVPFIARGSGVVRQVELSLAVQRPSFTLAVDSAELSLSHEQTVTATVSTAAVHGANDLIWLSLENAPPGLAWSFEAESLLPGESRRLVLGETRHVAEGRYVMQVAGEDGRNRVLAPLVLVVSRPDFGLAVPAPRLAVQPGDLAIYPLSVSASAGWSAPVTLTVEEADLPAGARGGFLLRLPHDGQPLHPLPSVEVRPPQQLYVAVSTSLWTPAGLYLLNVDAAGDGLRRTRPLALQIVPAPTEPLRLYLPVITAR